MIIYLDETYDHNRTWLLLGALFNPSHNKIHKQVKGILAQNAYSGPGCLGHFVDGNKIPHWGEPLRLDRKN